MDYLCEVWTDQMSKCKYQNVNPPDVRWINMKIFAFCILTFDFSALLFICYVPAGCKPRKVTIPTTQTDTESQFQVRALLLDNITSCTFKTTSPCTVTDGNPAIKNLKFEISNSESGVYIQLTGGRITIADLLFSSTQITISPDYPHIFGLNGDSYRGNLRLTVKPDSNCFDVINVVPMEAYLAGVVGAEMPSYWEPEALKAQAIAARTYCLYIKRQFGDNRNWDIKKTQAHQLYLGIKGESPQVWEAVNQTQGQVLVCKQVNDNEDIFPAYYSSSCGGHTENSNHVFGDSFEPLVGVPCPYCKDIAKSAFFFWPDVQFDNNDVTARLFQRYPTLKQLGEITDIIATKQSSYQDFSRLTEVRLLGSTGKNDFLKAEDLRLTINPTGNKIKSTICQIVKLGGKWAFLSGRGYGHGVGMCQCGAQALARQGKTAEQILAYYYPTSKIVSFY